MGRILTEKDIEAAVRGGSVYAAGGGGWADHGRMLGGAAVRLGKPELVSVDELPPDAIVATAAAIGAPAGTTAWEMLGIDYVKAAELLAEALGKPIAGFMVGPERPIVDAQRLAAGGRARRQGGRRGRRHPRPSRPATWARSALPARPNRRSRPRSAATAPKHRYIELVVRGATAKVSPILRTAADQSGGFIASCRAPVSAAYVKTHAALGGISLALEARRGDPRRRTEGRRGGDRRRSARRPAATIVAEGAITRKAVVYTKEAFDIGTVTIGAKRKAATLHVMNEYMALDDADGRTPRDLPRRADDARPVGRAALGRAAQEGMRVLVLRVPKTIIPLGAGVLDPSVYPPVEKAMGIEIARYALGVAA